MTLLRAAARTMLASVFVVNGVKALRDPEALVPVAEPFADRVVPLAKKYAPEQVAANIPEDTVTLVRLGGALQVVGGLGLATGKARRGSALLLAVSLIPRTMASSPFQRGLSAEEKEKNRGLLLQNLAVMGGVLVASQDTEGRPSLAWRAQSGTERLAHKAEKTKREITRDVKRATAQAKKQAEQARKEARKQAKSAKKAITS